MTNKTKNSDIINPKMILVSCDNLNQPENLGTGAGCSSVKNWKYLHVSKISQSFLSESKADFRKHH